MTNRKGYRNSLAYKSINRYQSKFSYFLAFLFLILFLFSCTGINITNPKPAGFGSISPQFNMSDEFVTLEEDKGATLSTKGLKIKGLNDIEKITVVVTPSNNQKITKEYLRNVIGNGPASVIDKVPAGKTEVKITLLDAQSKTMGETIQTVTVEANKITPVVTNFTLKKETVINQEGTPISIDTGSIAVTITVTEQPSELNGVLSYSVNDDVIKTGISVTITLKDIIGEPSGYIYNWGDGTISELTRALSQSHTYNKAGKYPTSVQLIRGDDTRTLPGKTFTVNEARIILNGSLIKLSSSVKIYVVDGNYKKYITGEAAGKSNNYNINSYLIVSEEEMNRYQEGSPIYIKSGTVVKLANDVKCYLIEGTTKKYIENEQAARDNNLNINNYVLIAQYELDQYSSGVNIVAKSTSTPTPAPVVYNPRVTVTSSMNSSAPVVKRGQGTFTQSGKEFPPNITVYLYFQKPDGSMYDPLAKTTDWTGAFTNPWSPSISAMTGTYYWWVRYTYNNQPYETGKVSYRVDS